MVDVMLGLDATGTAQNLRAAINGNQGDTHAVADGDSTALTIRALSPGPGGATIALSASAAQPVASHSTLQKNSLIKVLIGGAVSNLRGVVTTFFNGRIGANNPYPKAWQYRVRRWSAGWEDDDPWYPSRAMISLASGAIKAMNPAHIVYQCLTDRAWGLGIPANRLDEPSFYSAANTLYDEGFGLCLSWNRQTELEEFIPTVIAHIGAAFYTDRATGLLTLRLVRADYDAGTLPVFDYNSGLLSIEDDDNTSGDTSHNEVIVNWHDPIENKARSARVQNLAAIQALGAVVSVTLDYPGIPTADLAARVAQRDLGAQAGGIRRFKMTFDRRGRKIAPGGVFKISVPSRGIAETVIRAASVEEGKPENPAITVLGIQDVFSLPDAAYVAEEPSTWVPPDTGAAAAGTRRWREADYRSLVQRLDPANLAALAVDAGFAVLVAKQPTSLSLDYILATAGDGEDYAERGAFGWCPNGLLSFDIREYTTSVTLQSSAVGLDQIGAVPCVAWIENEVVGVTAYDPIARTATITRGVLDTVPAQHAAGARMWFPERFLATDSREYAPGETVRMKVLTRSSGSKLDLGSATEDEVIVSGRQGKPYPPGNVRVDGTRYAEDVVTSGEFTVTWAHRDRVLQADTLVPHGDSNVGPEAGTTYTIRLESPDPPTLAFSLDFAGDDYAESDGTDTEVVREVSGISGTSWTYTEAMWWEDFPLHEKTMTLFSVRGGIESMQRYVWVMTE